MALLVNPGSSVLPRPVKAVLQAARALGLRTPYPECQHRLEIDAAFANLLQLRADALFVAPDVFFNARAEQLAALRLVMKCRRSSDAVSCRGRRTDELRNRYCGHIAKLGIYAGQILKGEKPADLPVVQSTKFEFVINLKTAKALGITVPLAVLAIADEVIE